MRYANGWMTIRGKFRKVFVCGATYKRIKELIKVKTRTFDSYWSKCGSKEMKLIADGKEGIWVLEDNVWTEIKL